MEHIPHYLVLKDPVDILRKSLRIFSKNWKELVLITLLPVLFSFGVVNLDQTSDLTASGLFIIIISAIFAVISAVLSMVSAIALIKALSLGYKDKKIDVADTYAWGFRKFWGFIFVGILSSLIVIGGSIFFIIPGLILNLFMSFAAIIYVVENTSASNAIHSSFSLVYKRGWRVFMRVVFLIVTAIGAMMFVYMAFRGVETLFAGLGSLTVMLVSSVLSILFSLFVNIVLLPVAMGFLYGMYEDLKESRADHDADSEDRMKLTVHLFMSLGIIVTVTFLVLLPIILSIH